MRLRRTPALAAAALAALTAVAFLRPEASTPASPPSATASATASDALSGAPPSPGALPAVPPPTPDPRATAPVDAEAGAVLDRLLGDGMDATTIQCLASGVGADEAPPLMPADAPGDLQATVARISTQLEDIRGLRFDHRVEAEVLGPDAVAARIGDLFEKEYDALTADTEERLLTVLGAVSPGTDLASTRKRMLGEQVAGFYMPETGDLVVRATPGRALGPTDRATLAHELDHALTDQRLGIPDTAAMDADAALATTAVVEGDATLAMSRWSSTSLSLLEQLGMLAQTPELAAATQGLDDAPHYLAQELMFPYTAGLTDTCRRWTDGGWDAVDAAYRQPPATSAAVLFPDLHADADQPLLPAPLTLTEDGWHRRDDDTFGAAPLLWLFQAPGDDPDAALDDPRGRARAWAGGRSAIWTHDDRTAVGLAFTDGGTGSRPLCTSLEDWYGAAFPSAVRAATTQGAWFDGDTQDAVVRCSGSEVRLGIAPDLATAEDVVG